MERELPKKFKLGARELREMRDVLCDNAAGDCPQGGCKGCVFGMPAAEFRKWLSAKLGT